MIGSIRQYTPTQGDTFLDLARFYGLGYNELENRPTPASTRGSPASRRQLDHPARPPGSCLKCRYEGVVVNIPEMRLYYFHPHKDGGPLLVTTYPVGLGRDEWRTPKGKFKVQGKTVNPTWIIPDSIREEHIRESGDYRT